MVSTAADYLRFLQMYLEGGSLEGSRILDGASVELGTTSHTDDVDMPSGSDNGYGFGWSVEQDGTFSHGGSDGTWAWVDPAREIVGIVFTQSPGGKIPRQQFRRVVNASIY
jgi:CubicO group peptidase (beta-lactamase class C family)